MENSLIIIIVQIVVVFSLITIITLLIRYNNAIKLDKRISKHSIKYVKNKDNASFLDKVYSKYLVFVKKQRRKNKQLFPTLAKRYDKYVTVGDTKAIDFITHKMVICVLFILLMVVGNVIQGKMITPLQFVFGLVFGFYILDIILAFINISNKKKIEEDMLRAVMIINNAFKSGKSTIQAIEIASKKLPNPIGREFKRIHEEMKYGLSIDVVFDRFAKRVNLEEAEYLSSSLTILNKTGGNIIAVFNAIEKTLFDKMKLKDELKNSTLMSKLLVIILIIVPVVFVFLIGVLDPDYFKPFLESNLGLLMMGIIILMFIIYVYLLLKIVKVEY